MTGVGVMDPENVDTFQSTDTKPVIYLSLLGLGEIILVHKVAAAINHDCKIVLGDPHINTANFGAVTDKAAVQKEFMRLIHGCNDVEHDAFRLCCLRYMPLVIVLCTNFAVEPRLVLVADS